MMSEALSSRTHDFDYLLNEVRISGAIGAGTNSRVGLSCRGGSGLDLGKMADDPIGPSLPQQIELAIAGGGCPAIGKIDDVALLSAFDRGMRRIDEALETLG